MNQWDQYNPPEMKTFSVAVAVAVLLAVVYLQESSAFPRSEVRTPPVLTSVSFVDQRVWSGGSNMALDVNVHYSRTGGRSGGASDGG